MFRRHWRGCRPNSYRGAAYVEPIAVGDVLIDMPLFLASGIHVKVPLEPTYQTAWEGLPEEMRTAVETGILPEVDVDDT